MFFKGEPVAAGVRRTVALLALALPVSAPGCGKQQAAPGQTAHWSPVAGGELRLLQEVPSSLDPVHAASVYEALPVNQLFDGLVAIGPSLNVVPGLASTWKISRDGKVYLFNLRDDVRFHDGVPVTSDDVVFTFQRVLSPEFAQHSLVFSYLLHIEGAPEYARGDVEGLAGVEAVDPRTVRIRLSEAHPSFLEALAMDGVRIVPRHVLDEVGEDAFGRNPVGTGPFRFEAWTPRGIRLVANRDYFGAAPYLAAVNLMFFEPTEPDMGVRRFLDGKLDVVQPGDAWLDRLTGHPATRIRRYQELSLSFLGLQCGTPPLDDALVRRAIAHAIDRAAFLAESSATRREAVGLLPPGLWGYSPSRKALPFDRGRARQLLLEAGHPGGSGLPPLELLIPVNSMAAGRLAEQVATDLGEIGVRVEKVPLSWAELSRRTDAHEGHMFLMAWIADLPDPETLLRTLFESGGSANYFAFHDERIDRLLQSGAREMSPVLRAEIYREAERRILELAPIVPLYHTLGVVATRKSVHGFEPGPLGVANVSLERVWIAPRGRS